MSKVTSANKKRRLDSDFCLKDGKACTASLGSEIPYLSLFCALGGQALLHIASYFILTTTLPDGYWPSFHNGWQRRDLNLVLFDSFILKNTIALSLDWDSLCFLLPQ